jgi:hypothetical protein
MTAEWVVYFSDGDQWLDASPDGIEHFGVERA